MDVGLLREYLEKVKELKNLEPRVMAKEISGETADVCDGSYIDPSAILQGKMEILENCYIGPGAVIRLDERDEQTPFRFGPDSNLQDQAVIHSNPDSVGKGVIIAHFAVVHGAKLEDGSVLYIGAVADSGAIIGKGSFLDQGSYVAHNIKIPENSYVSPGKKVMTQEAADKLPKTTEREKGMYAAVMKHNLHHAARECERIHEQRKLLETEISALKKKLN